MRHVAVVGAAAVLLLSASAQALDAPSRYSMEAELILESNGDTETGLGLDYFLTPVEDDSNPYAVQPFMQRASRVGVDVGQTEIPGMYPVVGGLDDPMVNIPVVYTLPALDRRLQITGSIHDLTDKADDDNLPWVIGVGVYVLDNLRVSTDVVRKPGDDVEAGLRMVDLECFMAGQKLGLEFAFTLRDSFGDYFRIGAGYYPMKELGVNFDVYAGDDVGDTMFEIGADYVLGPVVLGASYRTEEEVFTFDARFRF